MESAINEQILKHIGLLELRLSSYGNRIVIRDEQILAESKINPSLYTEQITHKHIIEGQEYLGVLEDKINRGASLLNPYEMFLQASRIVEIRHDGERVFLARRSLGGYNNIPDYPIPISLPKESEPWQTSYEGNAFDTLIHLEGALGEFQNQWRE